MPHTHDHAVEHEEGGRDHIDPDRIGAVKRAAFTVLQNLVDQVQSALANKANVGHGHTLGDVSNLTAALQALQAASVPQFTTALWDTVAHGAIPSGWAQVANKTVTIGGTVYRVIERT